ncbi:MAG: glycosyltransferase family 2 protein, partial [Candidatus Levyibacteriota bacterium]
MKKKVSIIIINWNGLNYLQECLPSLQKQDYPNTEIIVVDNASSDESVSYLKKNFPKVRIVLNDKNYGFAEANNIGYKYITGDYVLFLNNDTKVTRNFLSILVKKLEKDETIGGIQSKILLMDKPDHYDSIGAFLTGTGILYHYGVS